MKPMIAAVFFLAISACGVAPPRDWVEVPPECKKQGEPTSNAKPSEAEEAWMACVKSRTWRDCADPCATKPTRPYF